MSLILFSIASIGAVIFIVAFFRIVIASFRHHMVTGFISLIPGINLVVLPTVLNKTGKAFPLSILGLGIALVAWYAGGSQFVDDYLQKKTLSTETVKTSEVSVGAEVATDDNSAVTREKIATATVESHKTKEIALPPKPLYYIFYKSVEYSELAQLANEHIRITLVDGRIFEGKNVQTSPESLLLDVFRDGQSQVIKIMSKHIERIEKLARRD